ncbi:MAG: class IV adenylate cyclase [Gemmatimonadaceae bacterium]
MSSEPTREVELKAVVEDLRQARHAVDDAGGRLVFAGRLEDRRYDSANHALAGRDEVLRLRTYRDAERSRAHLDWKGPTQIVDAFKVRDELTTQVTEADALAAMLDHLGYIVIREIDRDIAQYILNGTTIRFERYPRMDTLVEVEGTPEGIEAAIAVMGIPRSRFTSERLPDFVRSYETRTGLRAALSQRELAGEYRYSVKDA